MPELGNFLVLGLGNNFKIPFEILHAYHLLFDFKCKLLTFIAQQECQVFNFLLKFGLALEEVINSPTCLQKFLSLGLKLVQENIFLVIVSGHI